jgi:hypothetical protein
MLIYRFTQEPVTAVHRSDLILTFLLLRHLLKVIVIVPKYPELLDGLLIRIKIKTFHYVFLHFLYFDNLTHFRPIAG